MTAQRDTNGRFARGNPGGPGNPHAERTEKLRAALITAVNAADVKRIIRAMVLNAEEGDVQAAALVLDRTLGKPRTPIDVNAEVAMASQVEHIYDQLSARDPGEIAEEIALMDIAADIFAHQFAASHGVSIEGGPTTPATLADRFDAMMLKLQELRTKTGHRHQTVGNGASSSPQRAPIARLPEASGGSDTLARR